MNLGLLFINIMQRLTELGNTLYEVSIKNVDISWATKVLNFFGAEVNLPSNISFMYIFTGASSIVILSLMIYRLFK